VFVSILALYEIYLTYPPGAHGPPTENRCFKPQWELSVSSDLHLHGLGIYNEEPVCRKCGTGEETAHRILFECEVLGRIRYSVLRHWVRARDNSPRTHQAPARPDKESRNF
jgi:hypothetical protein